MPFSRFTRVVVSVTCLPVIVALSGCRTRGSLAALADLSGSTVAAIYNRATNEFSSAVLLKPREVNPEAIEFKLAPLIISESPGGSRGLLPGDQISPGAPIVGSAPATGNSPIVYFGVGTIVLRHRSHAQLTYLWRQGQPSGAVAGGPILQGFRMTLNSAGEPVIWEVLTDSTGAKLIFVSQSLELAAAREHGPPLPRRRYSIESERAAQPDVAVARVIDDGPVTMGPILYLRSGTHDVSTLICRCMASQTRELTGTFTYELRPVAELHPRPDLGEFARDPAARLERALRLPRDF